MKTNDQVQTNKHHSLVNEFNLAFTTVCKRGSRLTKGKLWGGKLVLVTKPLFILLYFFQNLELHWLVAFTGRLTTLVF